MVEHLLYELIKTDTNVFQKQPFGFTHADNMAPKGGRKEDWETLDVGADSRLPPAHRFVFLLNSILLAGAPVCKLKFSRGGCSVQSWGLGRSRRE